MMEKESMPASQKRSTSNWHLQLEANRRFVLGGLLALCIAMLAVSSLRNPVDYDGYWHLKMGKDWVENGLSPYQDHYSFTHENEVITNPPVLFQVGLYAAVKSFGEWGGFVAVKLAAFLLTLGCMLAWLKQVKAPVFIYCLILPMLVLLLQLRAQVRPELFSYSLSIIALMLCRRANLQLTVTAIAPIVIFLLFWVNYHSSIFGYVIFFGLFIDIAARLIRGRSPVKLWRVWAGWGIILVAIGFLNPDFSHTVLNTILMPKEWKLLIIEYRASHLAYASLWSFYLLAFISIATIALTWHQQKFGYLLISLVLIYAGATMSRIITPAGIVLLGLFAHALCDQVSSANGRFPTALLSNTRLRKLANIVTLAIGLIPLWESVVFARTTMFSNQSYASMFPKHLVSYMQREGKNGRIFNEYAMGGFLIYHLSPQSKVFIDGRTGILYPVDHYLKWFSTKYNRALLSDTINLLNIDFVLLSNTPGMAQHMTYVPQMKLDFTDVRFSLYSRESAKLDVIGKLWARPHCLPALDEDQLFKEWGFAQKNLPFGSPIAQLTALATEYISAEKPLEWLYSMPLEILWDDDALRFAAYRALEHRTNELAITLFNSIANRQVKDDLALALAYNRQKQFNDAEKMLDLAITRSEWTFEYHDTVIMGRILLDVQTHRPLRNRDRAFLEKIFARANFAAIGADQAIDFSDFCDSSFKH